MIRIPALLRLLPFLALPAGAQTLPESLLLAGMEDCDGVSANGLQSVDPQATWQAYMGLAWPGPNGIIRFRQLAAGRVLSLSFRAGEPGQPVAGVLEAAAINGPPGRSVAISLSTCPGDFRRHVLGVGQICAAAGDAPMLHWGISTQTGAQFCPLAPNQVYWFNIAFVDLPHDLPAASACPPQQECQYSLVSRYFRHAEAADAVR
jgi:hypothetical protein